MQVLLLDGYNLIYRARNGFYKGDNACVYSFFRSLRVLIEKFVPDKAYFVLEGRPKQRLELDKNYKGTRVHEKDENFSRQRSFIIDLLKARFPIEVVRHANYECDDVLAYLIEEHPDAKCTVVSTDTDFLQLYNQHTNVEIYNPVKKKVADPPDCEYVVWKALRGDTADNISGFKGIGDKRAYALVSDPGALATFLAEGGEERYNKFAHNMLLIRFHQLKPEEIEQLERSGQEINWEAVREEFDKMKFNSIINDKSWDKFVSTFNTLL
jgi:DNA polymerase-1